MTNRLVLVASLVALPLATAYADDEAPGETPVMPEPSPEPIAPPSAYVAPAPPPAQPAPQNEDWNNVSHINGTPVKVGERNEYLYRYKRTNVSVNPFGAFWGYYDGSISYGLTQNVAIAGSLSAWSYDNDNKTGYQATVSLPIYFRRTYSGLYLEPGVIMRSSSNDYYCADSTGSGGCGSDAHNWAGPELLLGYHYISDSGLNFQMAFGPAKHIADNQMSSSSSPDVNAYFRVGYAF